MKKTLTLTAIAFICLSLHNNLDAQNSFSNKSVFTVEELKQDFSALRSSIEESHPGLYLYKSKSIIDSIFNANYSSLNKAMTGREFILLTCRVASQIGDGHLRVVPPKIQLDSLDNGPTAIPFNVYCIDNKLYVRKNYSPLDDKEFLGSQIISINGHSIEGFIKEYLQIFPSDGNNLTHKYRLLSSSRYFTRYFSMLYGYAEQYNVDYISLNETALKTKTLQGLTFDKLLKIAKERYPDKIEEQKPAYFKINEDKKYAYLKIKSFDKGQYKKNKMNFEKFLKVSFKKMKSTNVPNLIIDVRDNGGGTDEYGRILFSYFVTEPFDYYRSLRMNKESFDCFKYTNRPDMKAPTGMLKPNKEGTFDNVQHPNVGRLNPLSPIYAGNIYVLINGWCFSTTSEFLSQIHFHTKAVFIGEESGGGYYGNCSGPTPDFTLPNTKVRIEIPLMNYRMAVENYQYLDRGLIPNYTVTPSIIDKVSNIDLELNLTKKLIDDK
ncbi:MAG: hypothetical protein IPG21_17700 [Saprospiraceae bacterium]|nr:hypothetical protein [Candidatus Vicinibacter affinis]MBK7800918.1 hypothetical protein [Candidatus Vicinibacter affinis]